MASPFLTLLNANLAAAGGGPAVTPSQARLLVAEVKEANTRVILDVVDESIERARAAREQSQARREERRAQEARRDEAASERQQQLESQQAARAERDAIEAQRQARADASESFVAEILARQAARNIEFAG